MGSEMCIRDSAGSKRTMIPFNTVHLPQRFSIKADEIQGIRAFGTRSELQSVQDAVNKRLAKCRRQLDATHEFQRMGALNGQILDADGKTVLLDIYKTFGVTRKKVKMGLNSPDTLKSARNAAMLWTSKRRRWVVLPVPAPGLFAAKTSGISWLPTRRLRKPSSTLSKPQHCEGMPERALSSAASCGSAIAARSLGFSLFTPTKPC